MSPWRTDIPSGKYPKASSNLKAHYWLQRPPSGTLKNCIVNDHFLIVSNRFPDFQRLLQSRIANLKFGEFLVSAIHDIFHVNLH
jgi:hypothetical protein